MSESKFTSKFIVIEGLIGVGKTTLCKILQREREAQLILEPAEDNPFLASFYADPKRFAFPAQMFYLHSRTLQQNKLLQPSLFQHLYVSDYIFAKDRLFAEQTLSGEEFILYERFSSLLANQVAKPDFVLFLDAPTDVIMGRIQNRGIASEQTIQAEYLDELRNRYYRLWDSYEDAPIYVFNSSNTNYATNEDDVQHMLKLIDGWLEGNPLPNAPKAYKPNQPVDLPLFNIQHQ